MLQKATEDDLNNLLEAWEKICSKHGDEGTIFANDITQKVSSLLLNISKPEFFAYVIKNDSDEFVALLDIMHALPKSNVSWLKLFDMTITPNYILGSGNFEAFIDALSESIMMPIELLFGNDHGNAKEIKVYGRTENMVELFKATEKNEAIQNKLDTIDLVCLQEGKWLIFRKK